MKKALFGILLVVIGLFLIYLCWEQGYVNNTPQAPVVRMSSDYNGDVIYISVDVQYAESIEQARDLATSKAKAFAIDQSMSIDNLELLNPDQEPDSHDLLSYKFILTK